MSDQHDVLAYASVLELSRKDVRALKIYDAYALHKVVYGLFSDVRTEAEKASGSVGSGILYVDDKGDQYVRKVLMLSNRIPHQTPQFGKIQTRSIFPEFLSHKNYAFEVSINPVRRVKNTIKPIKNRDEIIKWFLDKSSSAWGFLVNPERIQLNELYVQTFDKGGNQRETITHGVARLSGVLSVTDSDVFRKSFTSGIGRGRAFGLGLLKIIPVT